jgi:hypothetical protein
MEESLIGGRRNMRRKMFVQRNEDRFRLVEVIDFGGREPN